MPKKKKPDPKTVKLCKEHKNLLLISPEKLPIFKVNCNK